MMRGMVIKNAKKTITDLNMVLLVLRNPALVKFIVNRL